LLPQKTGLSACIFFACGKKGYRCNPLREPKPRSGFGFAEFALRANSWASLGEFGAPPQTPKTKTRSVLVPLARAKAEGFRLGSFASQNSGRLSFSPRF
jgi:hypothetical protein